MDKELLFKSNLSEEEIEVPGRGTLRVRAMTRDELHTLKAKNKTDTGAHERKVLSACLVDPELTEDEVLRWQQAAPAGELSAVVEKLMEISGLADDAQKSGLSGDGDDA